MRFSNPTAEQIAVRDDAGKHHVEPGGSIDITGDQHAPVWSEAGLVRTVAEPAADDGESADGRKVAELRAILTDRGIAIPPDARKADLVALVEGSDAVAAANAQA